jgi:CRP/FNR family transcriptional regulator, cyclic AMP receptor protein
MSDPQHYLPILNASRWYARLPPDFAQALLRMARVRHLQAGEALFLRDGPPCGLYALVSGTIRLSGLSGQHNEAREALLGVIVPPQWFGEIAVFDGLARTHHAHASEACTLLQIPQTELLPWLQDHPEHWRELGLLMADKLRMAFVIIEDYTVLNAPQRLTRRLIGMAEGYGQRMDDGSTRRVLAITQEELALIIGASRQTTNQILKEAEARGILRVQRGGMEILDLAALRALCA